MTAPALHSCAASAVLTLAGFTLREAFKNRLLSLTLVVLIASFGIGEFIGDLAITERTETKVSLLGAFLRIFAVFITSLFVTMSMARELQDKGLDLILSMPIPRAAYYFGRLLGYSAGALGIAVLIALCLWINAPSHGVLIWLTSLACELLLITALSMLALLTFNQPTAGMSVILGFYFFSRAIASIQLIGRSPLLDSGAFSQKFMSALVDAISFLLPELHRFTLSEWLTYDTARWADLLPIAGQTLVYEILLVGAGLFDLYRKNL